MMRRERPKERSWSEVSRPRPWFAPVTRATLEERFVDLEGQVGLVRNWFLMKMFGKKGEPKGFMSLEETIVI